MLSPLRNWRAPEHWTKITTLDLHTGGEPFRVITGGWPDLKGDTTLARRVHQLEQQDVSPRPDTRDPHRSPRPRRQGSRHWRSTHAAHSRVQQLHPAAVRQRVENNRPQLLAHMSLEVPQ